MNSKDELLRKYFSIEIDESGSMVSGELRKLVENILKPWRGAYESWEKDEFYSLAGEIFTKIIDKYDESKGDFDIYFASCLSKRIKDYFKKKNRDKRMQKTETSDGGITYIKPVSIDSVIYEGGDETIADYIPDGKTVEDIVFSDESQRAEKYMSMLSDAQKKIVELLMDGYTRSEITERLNLTGKSLDDAMAQIRSYEKVSVLREKQHSFKRNKKNKDRSVVMAKLQTSKTIGYQVGILVEELEDKAIRLDYCLQRYPGQWNEFTKYNFIVDIVEGNPIPEIVMAEEVVDGHVVNWVIDGLQRVTILASYRNNEFKVGKNVERPTIRYQRHEIDEEGKDIYINEEFDIRGKYYKQLPRELQRAFDSYTVHAILYMGCSKEDIEYHLRRYNRCAPMTRQQKAVTYISEQFGKYVRKLSGHKFFLNNPITEKSRKNGDLEKIIIDSIMMTFFADSWSKDVEKNALFLKENLTDDICFEMKEILDRLDSVWDYSHNINKEHKANTYLFIALFKKLIDLGIEAEKFTEFYKAFVEYLSAEEFDGISFDNFKHSSRDKSVVGKKFAYLEALMHRFCDVKEENIQPYTISNEEVKAYIDEFKEKEYVKLMHASDDEITEAALRSIFGDKPRDELETTANTGFSPDEQDLVENVLERLDDLDVLSTDINIDSCILTIKYIPALIAALTHGYTELEEYKLTEEWFIKYGNGNHSNKTIDSVIGDLDTYITQKKCA